MLSQIFELDPGRLALLIPILTIVSLFLIAVTAVIAGAWRRVRQVEIEMSFKSELIERGMSIEEIDRLIRAGRDSRSRHRDGHRAERPCASDRL